MTNSAQPFNALSYKGVPLTGVPFNGASFNGAQPDALRCAARPGQIARHLPGPTDAIVTADDVVAERFLAAAGRAIIRAIVRAIVMHYASSQFAGGAESGLGAKIGSATGQLQARGPVALEGLATYKWLVRGTGQARP
jgi:hypothetical protein